MLIGLTDGTENKTWDEMGAEFGSAPFALINAVRKDVERGHNLVSASQLTGCLRKAWLERRVDYFQQIGGRLVPLMGTLFHAMLENSAEKEAYTEIGMKWTLNGVVITGTTDYFNPTTGVLRDYKTARKIVPARLPYGSHEAQVNIYRGLLAHNEHGYKAEASSLEVTYIDLMGAAKDHTGVVTINIPLWSNNKLEDYLAPRINELAAADAFDVPPSKADRGSQWLCNYCPDAIRSECDRI